jgi:hypothetical protein
MGFGKKVGFGVYLNGVGLINFALKNIFSKKTITFAFN